MNEAINEMLSARVFAVVGASTNPDKYGYKAYRALLNAGKVAYPVNPRAKEIDGNACFASVADVPEVPDVVVSVVPPALTEALVPQLAEAGVSKLWIQPGAESQKAVTDAEASDITVVHGGPCIMVGLRTHGRG